MNAYPGEKIKVVYIHHGSVLGGATVSLLNTIQGVQETSTGFNLKVLCFSEAIQPFYRDGAGVPVSSIYNPGLILGRVLIGLASLTNIWNLKRTIYEALLLPLSIFRQYKQLKAEKPDVVHLNSSILASTAIAARFAAIPLVWHIREVVTGRRFNIRRILMGLFIRKIADKVITISPFEASRLGKDKGNKVEVVYNFVDFSHFDPDNFIPFAEKARFGLSPDDKLIISIGGNSFRKGTFQLIEAMKYVDERIKLVIAGSKPYYSKHRPIKKRWIDFVHRIENFFISRGLKDYYYWYYNDRVVKALSDIQDCRIIFTGELNDVAPLISACDILAFAGTTPHFPRPVYEAWVMKKPVIVFDMDGITQNVDHEKDGLVVAKRTGKALGEAISSIILNPEKLKKMGETGYQKAEQRFRRNRNVLKILDIYLEITGKKDE